MVGAGDRGGCVVLVLDEMDVLLARKQKVLYDLLEWPSRRNTRMALIGIANTMDLPERMLPRLGSRLGLNRLVYPPYTREQIQRILTETVDQRQVKFQDPALRLCATKVGGVSGDVRRALELCRRAREIVEDRVGRGDGAGAGGAGAGGGAEVTANDMQCAIREATGDFRIVALSQLSLVERVSLVGAIDVARRHGAFEMEWTCSMEGVCEAVMDLVTRMRAQSGAAAAAAVLTDLTVGQVEEACWRLAGMRMVVIERAAVQRLSRVIVNVSVEDCKHALEHCAVCRAVLCDA